MAQPFPICTRARCHLCVRWWSQERTTRRPRKKLRIGTPWNPTGNPTEKTTHPNQRTDFLPWTKSRQTSNISHADDVTDHTPNNNFPAVSCFTRLFVSFLGVNRMVPPPQEPPAFSSVSVRLPSYSDERFWSLSQIETFAKLVCADELDISHVPSQFSTYQTLYYFCIEDALTSSASEIGHRLAVERFNLSKYDQPFPVAMLGRPIVFVDILSRHSSEDHDLIVERCQSIGRHMMTVSASEYSEPFYLSIGVSHDERVAPALSFVSQICERTAALVVVRSRGTLLGLGKGNGADPDGVDGAVQSICYVEADAAKRVQELLSMTPPPRAPIFVPQKMSKKQEALFVLGLIAVLVCFYLVFFVALAPVERPTRSNEF